MIVLYLPEPQYPQMSVISSSYTRTGVIFLVPQQEKTQHILLQSNELKDINLLVA